MDSKIRKLGTEVIIKPWEIAFIGHEVKKSELFKYMGKPYPSIQEWRADIGIARSTFFRGVRLVENLMPHIPKKELRTIPMENAEWLLKLPAGQRSNPDMWAKARTMTEADFMEVVNNKRRSNGESPEDGRITFKLRCYAGQADIYKTAIERMSEQQNLTDDHPRALELICADFLASAKDGKSFIAKLGERITGAAFEMAQLNSVIEGIRKQFAGDGSAADILQFVTNQLDPLQSGVEKAIKILAEATNNMAMKKGQQPLAMQAAAASAAAGTSSKVH